MKLAIPYGRFLCFFLSNFIAGSCMMLMGSTLVLWLKEDGLCLEYLGLISLLHLPFALRFLWGAYVHHVASMVPRWVMFLVLSVGATLCVASMALVDTAGWMFFVLLVVFKIFLANYDLTLIVSQADLFPKKFWGYSESISLLGYRMGMLIGSALPLYLSSFYTWKALYITFGVLLTVKAMILMVVGRGQFQRILQKPSYTLRDALSAVSTFLRHPIYRYTALLCGIFLAHEYMKRPMAMIMFQDLGFSKAHIAFGYKTIAVVCSSIGGFLAGYHIKRYGVHKALRWGTYADMGCAASFFGFFLYHHLGVFYCLLAVEEMCRGYAMTSYFSYQLSIAHPRHVFAHISFIVSCAYAGEMFFGTISGLIASYGWIFFVTFGFILSTLPLLLLSRVAYIPPKMFQKS